MSFAHTDLFVVTDKRGYFRYCLSLDAHGWRMMAETEKAAFGPELQARLDRIPRSDEDPGAYWASAASHYWKGLSPHARSVVSKAFLDAFFGAAPLNGW